MVHTATGHTLFKLMNGFQPTLHEILSPEYGSDDLHHGTKEYVSNGARRCKIKINSL
jgi:hypothetical protein